MSENPEESRSRADRDFYHKWRERARSWAGDKKLPLAFLESLLATPDFAHLLVRLMADGRVSWVDKAKVGVALAYIASPVDLLPEVLFGPAGVLDDIAVVAWALKGLLREENWDLLTEHWAGDERILDLLQKAVGLFDDKIGSGRWRRLKAFAASAEQMLPGREPRLKGRSKIVRLPRERVRDVSEEPSED